MTVPAGRRALAETAEQAIERVRAEQMELLPPSRFEGAAVPSPVPETRRRGRPIGARNMATREVLRFLDQVCGDPLIEGGRWLQLTPEAMAAELGCSKLEAFDRQQKIREFHARFKYAPLAPVDGDGNAVVPFFQVAIGGGGAPGAGAPPWVYAGGPATPQIEQNQALNDAEPAVSHEPVSHEGDK